MDEGKRENSNIDSLQALRAWAFMGVFLTHTDIMFLKLGAWGVSVFFILSGFLMTYSYYGKKRIVSVSLTENILFAWNKIKHLYPLHIITMFAMIVFMFTGEGTISIMQAIVRILLNVLLLQCWVPIQSDINGVSWYLCVTVFLYFLFPYILRNMERKYSISKARWMLVILFLIQIGVGGGIGSHIQKFNSMESVWIQPNLTRWFVYFFPPVRALDFAIGCNLGYCFLIDGSKKLTKKTTTLLELLTIALIIVANVCTIKARFGTGHGDTTIASAYSELWWTYTIIFTVSSCMIIWLFAKPERGYISGYLVNRFTIYIGNISSFTFLIHSVVFRYIEVACNFLFGLDFLFAYGKWIKLSLGFVLTIIAAQVWMAFIHKKIKF